MADVIATPSLPITGGCGCGAVRFEVSEPLLGAGYCHCRICQHRTGTAVQATAAAAYGSVTVTQGAEHIGTWTPTAGKAKQFCRECGSALFAVDQQDEKIVFVRMGAFDEDPGVRPATHQFVAYAAPWEPIPDDGLPRFPESMAAGNAQ